MGQRRIFSQPKRSAQAFSLPAIPYKAPVKKAAPKQTSYSAPKQRGYGGYGGSRSRGGSRGGYGGRRSGYGGFSRPVQRQSFQRPSYSRPSFSRPSYSRPSYS